MSEDESEYISNMIEYGWLDVDRENTVVCWADGKTYKAKITFEEVEE